MKKLFAVILTVAMLASMSVTAFAEENETATITVEMADSARDGWDDRARILALSVPSSSDMEDEEDILGVFTLEDGASGTQTLTIGKNQTVYFFWLFDNEGTYNYEASFTIKRDGVTIYTHADETDECPLTNWQCLVVSEPIDPRFTTVTYEVAPTYTVTIPETVTIGADGTEKTVSAEDVVVEKGKYVSVSLAADNDFAVATAEGAELTYTVTANGENVAAGGEILAVNPTDGKTGSATVTFDIDESAIQYAGTYTGSATFTIAVKDVPPINFTMDSSVFEEWIPGLTANLQAEAGMTWGEWVESEYNVDDYVMGDWGIFPEGEDWVAVRDTQIDGFDGIVLPTDEIIADNTYTLIQILG